MTIVPMSTGIGSPPGFCGSARRGRRRLVLLRRRRDVFRGARGAAVRTEELAERHLAVLVALDQGIRLLRAIFATRAYFGHAKSMPSNRRLSNRAAGVVSPGAVTVNFSIQLLPRESRRDLAVGDRHVIAAVGVERAGEARRDREVGLEGLDPPVAERDGHLHVEGGRHAGALQLEPPVLGRLHRDRERRGPGGGQLMSLTSADSSVTSSVVTGLTASSLSASRAVAERDLLYLQLELGRRSRRQPAHRRARGAGRRAPRAAALRLLAERHEVDPLLGVSDRAERQPLDLDDADRHDARDEVGLVDLTFTPGIVKNGSVRPAWRTSSPATPTSPLTEPRLRPPGSSSIASATATFTRPARGAAGALGQVGMHGAPGRSHRPPRAPRPPADRARTSRSSRRSARRSA